MRSLSILILFSLSCLACHQPDSISPDTLTGTWIETSAGTDTLIFNLDQTGHPLPNSILVNRGKERNADGYLIPKIGSGIYQYELQGNTITVLNMLSSSTQRTSYRIEQKGNTLQVDNFFELGFHQPATATRTLRRL
ncbi:hypothetical protein [Spirosoma sp. KNUC1025]|uniref:hypothetical protein n=1 Tax=Spirosoma sp. KNUC1025 TaxID=2894082 RepID=UPI003864D251|nr:hypothetical protein LN737_15620 [Spirosoma sp. KNUC1025]